MFLREMFGFYLTKVCELYIDHSQVDSQRFAPYPSSEVYI